MKKTICMILAVLMSLISISALAEANEKAGAAFSQTWVSEGKDGYTVDIVYDEESKTFEVVAVKIISDDEDYSIEFSKCAYEAEQNVLICTGGVLVHEVSTEDEEEDISEETATGISATLTIDKENRLHWSGSGKAIPDQIFTSLAEDPFVGEWASGDTVIYIDRTGAEYEVSITKETGEDEETCWDYRCTQDGTDRKLTGIGTKSTETYNEDSQDVSETFENTEGDAVVETFDTVVKYSDGTATFTIDGDELLWDDAKEKAGEGIRFVKVRDEE